MHLEGMHNILRSHGFNDIDRPSTPTHFRIHLLEVMGVMDLPYFSVGRQSPRIGIWRRYCQSAAPRYGVEPVSGIPRTLLDIFAGIGAETTEQTFWDWPGEPGSFLQCYLWEAHKLAGILAFRRGSRNNLSSQGETAISTWRQPARCPADTTALVTRIMANLDAMRLAFIERPTEDTFIKNATIFPMFVAGLEVSVLCRRPEWQQFIRRGFTETHQGRILLGLLEELWGSEDSAIDVDGLARSRGIEMGLL
jgi:hypothetical protein